MSGLIYLMSHEMMLLMCPSFQSFQEKQVRGFLNIWLNEEPGSLNSVQSDWEDVFPNRKNLLLGVMDVLISTNARKGLTCWVWAVSALRVKSWSFPFAEGDNYIGLFCFALWETLLEILQLKYSSWQLKCYIWIYVQGKMYSAAWDETCQAV